MARTSRQKSSSRLKPTTTHLEKDTGMVQSCIMLFLVETLASVFFDYKKNGFLRFVFVSSHLFGDLFVCLLMNFGVFTCKGLYVLKKMIWTLLGSKGWWSDTMISFLRSILYHIELLRYNLFKVTSTFFVVVRVLMSSCLFISLTDLRYCIADMSRYKTGQV